MFLFLDELQIRNSLKALVVVRENEAMWEARINGVPFHVLCTISSMKSVRGFDRPVRLELLEEQGIISNMRIEFIFGTRTLTMCYSNDSFDSVDVSETLIGDVGVDAAHQITRLFRTRKWGRMPTQATPPNVDGHEHE